MSSISEAIRGSRFYRLAQEYRERRNQAARVRAQNQRMQHLYAQFISPGGLCFDVGANIGDRVGVFLKLGGKVVAVEPQTACVKALKQKFGANPNLTIIQKALGASPGTAEMALSKTNTISSLSPGWIKAVKESGRFANETWDEKQIVAVETLDGLIAGHGMPEFIKIDVEGFEFEVLRGLTAPGRSLSFEFTPEFLDSAKRCLEHLQSLGNIELNYSFGETMKLELAQWTTPARVVQALGELRNDHKIFGDIYVKFQGQSH